MSQRFATRLLAAGGSMLAVGGLGLALVASGPALADTAGVTANSEVKNVIELTADDEAFTLSEAPGATASASSSLTAKSNNEAGYNITVEADAAALSGTGTNADTIPVSALEVGGAAVSDSEAVQVHTQGEKSAEAGDTVTADYEMEMPFVNADTYSVGLTFTAAAN